MAITPSGPLTVAMDCVTCPLPLRSTSKPPGTNHDHRSDLVENRTGSACPYLPVVDGIMAPDESRQLKRYVSARSAHFTNEREGARENQCSLAGAVKQLKNISTLAP